LEKGLGRVFWGRIGGIKKGLFKKARIFIHWGIWRLERKVGKN